MEAFTAQLRRAAPALMERLGTGRRTSDVAGMLHCPNHLRRAYGRGWALVGDAGYHRDPVTGHGISDAYRDAEVLALALHRALQGDTDERTALAGYQRERDQALRDVFELTCAMAHYPPVTEFVELQKQLGRAIDFEATALASRTPPGERTLARASAARAINREGEQINNGQRLEGQHGPGRHAPWKVPHTPSDVRGGPGDRL